MKGSRQLFENLKDPRWRLNNLYLIINKQSERIKYQENSIQKQINDNDSPRKIILKARQFGVTTNEVLKLFDRTIFNRNVTSCIIAHEQDAIEKIFRIVRRAYRFLPDPLKPRVDKGGGSKYAMSFPEINSLIYCDLESRGDTINNLHISEAAFMEYERFVSTMQAVPLNGGRVTLESTANGMDNFFYELWNDEGNIYDKIFLPWFFHSEYQIPTDTPLTLDKEEQELKNRALDTYQITLSDAQFNYRRFKKEELKAAFVQEYPEDDISCFIHSGRSVVDQLLFKKLITKCLPVSREVEGCLIFRERDIKKDYVVGADVSQGIGGDYSAASVLCIQDREEVASFRGQISPFLFAKKLKWLCDFFSSGYRLPLLAVESNNHGHAVLLELVENIGYQNLFFAKPEQPGWLTNSVTRPVMLDQLIEAVSSEGLAINSKQTLHEMITLVEEKGKIQAATGKFDDCVIATAIAFQMLMLNTSKIKLYENIGRNILV
jgi:hypothetical protein